MPDRLTRWWRYRARPTILDWREAALLWIVWRTPKSLIYWAFIRLASQTGEDPGTLTVEAVLRRHSDWYRR
jgi:hypothetical protein